MLHHAHRPQRSRSILHEHPPPRLGRARACAGLEDRREPAAREALLRARQCRHRPGGELRGARHRRPRGGDRVLQVEPRSISWWSGRRRRSAPASSTISPPPASRRSGRARRRRGSKARRASPRTCARPTASRPPPIERFTAAAPAKAYVRAQGAPIVVKADGLAAGKGVMVAASVAEAEAAIDMMFGGGLGEAGAEVVVEEFLAGEEASFFALCDGETAIAARLGAGPQARARRRPGARTPAAWAPIRRRR